MHGEKSWSFGAESLLNGGGGPSRPPAKKKETKGERDLRLCDEIHQWKIAQGLTIEDLFSPNLTPEQAAWLSDFERRWMTHLESGR